MMFACNSACLMSFFLAGMQPGHRMMPYLFVKQTNNGNAISITISEDFSYMVRH